MKAQDKWKFGKGDLVESVWRCSARSGQHLGIVMNVEIPLEEDRHDVLVQWNDGDVDWEMPSELKLVAKAK